MSKMNIGLIGAGAISDAHMGAYAKNSQCRLLAVADLNEDRARQKAAQYGADRIYTDYRSLLADPDIHAVSICVPNLYHADAAIAALEAGKHVLLEKPLCTTLEDAYRIQAAVNRSGRILMVGYVRRYDQNAQIARQFVENGDLGEIYYAKASFLRRLGNPGGWFADRSKSGGGPLLDIGVHVIDLCWFLMGRPKVRSVSGNIYNKLGNRSHIKNLSYYKTSDYSADINTVEDFANALIRFENGASLFVETSYTLHAKKDMLDVQLFGDKGGIAVDPELTIITEKYDTILNASPQIDRQGFQMESAFQNEIDHFVACCINNTKPLSPVEDGVELMKILTGIYESSEKGTEVQFE